MASDRTNGAPRPRTMTRRDFVKLAAMAGVLAGCGSAQPLPTPTPVPPTDVPPTSVPPTLAPPTPIVPTLTPSRVPTETPTPPPTLTPFPGRPAIIKMYPEVPSRVVYTRHPGVWSGDTLIDGAVRQMLDASITRLTGLNDARQAWAALFKPNERIGIKVNAFRNSIIWTHVPLVTAVVQSLQSAGIPAKQIIIFDAQSDEMKTAGYTLNKDGPGVRCYGSDWEYKQTFTVADSKVNLSDIAMNCDALINMPILKAHMITGMSFALKNHYGTVENPDVLHYEYHVKMPALNALPPIRERTRLIIGDILTANLKTEYGWPYWREAVKANSILMSYDPVAHDATGFQIFNQLLTDNQMDPTSNAEMCKPYLFSAAQIGLGTNDANNIDLVKVNLT